MCENTKAIDAVGENTNHSHMVGENTKHNNKSPLLPDRYPQQDFFVCDILDASPKGDMAAMEHPIFSLSTKPDRRARRYEHGANFVEVKPSSDGLATVHDRDILIYAISQVMAALNDGRRVERKLRFQAYDLLTATNRGTDGRGYSALKAALERLRGTSISTNIVTGGEEQWETFGILDAAKIVRETREGRMQEVEITLSDWVFNAIRAKEVLTLHKDYFRLRKPLERRIYELARKHCGAQKTWSIGLSKLKNKCGSNSTDKEFRRLLKNIVKQDQAYEHMPDYALSFDSEKDILTVQKRANLPLLEEVETRYPKLKPDTFEKARRIAKGWDAYQLEREWQEFWIQSGKPELKSADAAFLGFCKQKEPLR